MDRLNDRLEKCNMSGSDAEMEDPTEQLFYALLEKKGSHEAIIQEIESSGPTRRPDKITLVLASALFDDDQLSHPWISKHASILRRYATDAKAQRNVLIAIERALIHRAILMAKVPALFKALYDHDVVDEEIFIKWSKKTSSRRYVPREVSKLVHEKAQVFIDWLENAEEESSDEQEDVIPK